MALALGEETIKGAEISQKDIDTTERDEKFSQFFGQDDNNVIQNDLVNSSHEKSSNQENNDSDEETVENIAKLLQHFQPSKVCILG